MEHLDTLYDLCDVINRALKDANEKIRNAGGKLSAADTELLDKYTHILKSIKTSIAMIEEEQGVYSNRGMSYARGDRTGRVHWNDGRVSYGDSYGGMADDNSYARGRGANAKRDNMGRYSRADAKEDMIEQLHGLMNDADPAMRGEFQTFITKLERM